MNFTLLYHSTLLLDPESRDTAEGCLGACVQKVSVVCKSANLALMVDELCTPLSATPF
jgi:hypothetical protein